MNLRISEGLLRFRITREELQELLQGNTLRMALALARTYHYAIEISDGWDTLALKEDNHSWTLLVDSHALKAFSEQLPSRNGLCKQVQVAGQTLMLIFEVDVRKSPRT